MSLTTPELLTACPVHTEPGETISPCRRVLLTLKQTLTRVPSLPRLLTLIYSKYVCLQPQKLSPVSGLSKDKQVKRSSAHSCCCFNSCPTEVSGEHRRSRSLPPGTAMDRHWGDSRIVFRLVSTTCTLRQGSQVGSWMLTQLLQPQASQPSHTNPAKLSRVGSASFEDSTTSSE